MPSDCAFASEPADRSAPVFVFGAGKTGRGFLAHLCHDAGIPFVLVDRDEELVRTLRAERRYRVRVLSSPERVVELRPQAVYGVDDSWDPAFAQTTLCLTAVFGNNLDSLGELLSGAFSRRLSRSPGSRLNVITCENLAGAAEKLRSAVLTRLPDPELRKQVDDAVGFAEAIVLKTCLAPAAQDDPLTVRAQDFFELPCNAASLRAPLPAIAGIRPGEAFQHQLVRKLYTYNCINAVLTYLGARLGNTLLSEAAADPETYRWAKRAGEEASDALVAEFSFDRAEQDTWQVAALAKFADPRLPDPLSRNGADPRRKLGRDDRLIGPARLALRHGGTPRAMAEGIFAGFAFHDGEEPSLLEIHGDIDCLLREICGLARDEPLYEYLLGLWQERTRGSS